MSNNQSYSESCSECFDIMEEQNNLRYCQKKSNYDITLLTVARLTCNEKEISCEETSKCDVSLGSDTEISSIDF